jgi:hypothetical protein
MLDEKIHHIAPLSIDNMLYSTMTRVFFITDCATVVKALRQTPACDLSMTSADIFNRHRAAQGLAAQEQKTQI